GRNREAGGPGAAPPGGVPCARDGGATDDRRGILDQRLPSAAEELLRSRRGQGPADAELAGGEAGAAGTAGMVEWSEPGGRGAGRAAAGFAAVRRDDSVQCRRGNHQQSPLTPTLSAEYRGEGEERQDDPLLLGTGRWAGPPDADAPAGAGPSQGRPPRVRRPAPPGKRRSSLRLGRRHVPPGAGAIRPGAEQDRPA